MRRWLSGALAFALLAVLLASSGVLAQSIPGPGNIIAQTATSFAIQNSTAESDIGTLTVPAGFAWQTVRLRGWGTVSTQTGLNQGVTVSAAFGGQAFTFATGGISGGMTNAPINYDVCVTVNNTTSTTTFSLWGNLNAPTPVAALGGITSGTGVDVTQAQTLAVHWTWGTQSFANKLLIQRAILQTGC